LDVYSVACDVFVFLFNRTAHSMKNYSQTLRQQRCHTSFLKDNAILHCGLLLGIKHYRWSAAENMAILFREMLEDNSETYKIKNFRCHGGASASAYSAVKGARPDTVSVCAGLQSLGRSTYKCVKPSRQPSVEICPSSSKTPTRWREATMESLPCGDVLMLLWRQPLRDLQPRPRCPRFRELLLCGYAAMRCCASCEPSRRFVVPFAACVACEPLHQLSSAVATLLIKQYTLILT